MSAARRMLHIAHEAAWLAGGLIVFGLSGRTPARANQAMVSLFRLTGGASNDLLSRLLGRLLPPYDLGVAHGVFGAMDGERLRRILDGLREHGYHAFPDVLSPAQCDRLVEYARAGECEVTVLADGTRPATPRPQRYDRGAGGGMLHVFRPTDIVNLPEAQELLADASLIALAQAYLGCRPVLDLPGLWWTTPGRGGGSGEAAQLFHYDLDRLKWLKFFFYLTDVGPDNGPHVFVAGSHRSGGLAPALAERGYVRHSDAEVARAYPAERIVEMTGRRGTVFAVDTRGLHKGKPVVSGERLVLQIQFSNSLFGTRFAPARLDTTRPGALTDLWRRRPRLVSLFA